MSEEKPAEKPIEKNEEMSNPAPKVVNSEGMKAPSVNEKPTATDAGRFFIMMFTLFLALIPTISTVALAFMERNAEHQFIGALFVVLPILASILLSLPSIIIGRKHKNEKDTYRLFMILGIITVVVAIVSGMISAMNVVMMFKK